MQKKNKKRKDGNAREKLTSGIHATLEKYIKLYISTLEITDLAYTA